MTVRPVDPPDDPPMNAPDAARTVVAADPIRERRALAAERRIASASHLLDDLVVVPGTGHRIGLDPLIGLIPFAGDAITAVMAAWIIIESTRFGIPAIVIVRMLLNAGVDFAVGLIPFVGDLVDFGFKGNRRNLELFHRHALDPDADTTGSTALVVGVLLVFIGIIWLIAVLIARVLSTVVG